MLHDNCPGLGPSRRQARHILDKIDLFWHKQCNLKEIDFLMKSAQSITVHVPIQEESMEPESLARSPLGGLFVKALAAGMESRFRYRYFGPLQILAGIDGLEGRKVLEIGCGTGFFTLPAAGLIGNAGNLTSMDVLPDAVILVTEKVQAAGLKNVRVMHGNGMETGLEAETFDTVFLFGVIPAPMLPLDHILPEMRRVLKPGGTLAVWPPVPGLTPQAILQTGLFTLGLVSNGVHNFTAV
jgi:SAM-dependent methyltransferase